MKLAAHPTENELLRAADGELGKRDQARIEAHLSECWQCRAWRAEMNETIAEFVRLRREEIEGKVTDHSGPRAKFRAELAAIAQEPWTRRNSTPVLRLGYLSATVLLAIGLIGAAFLYRQNLTYVPKRSLTPGDTVLMSRSEVCSATLDESAKPIPASLEQAVFREYGIPNARPADYEMDYLITPELGGSISLRNLWPEPYSAKWNAHVKDQLESRLHEMVCRGDLDLATAQRDIAADWIAAYRKYFHTDKPFNDR